MGIYRSRVYNFDLSFLTEMLTDWMAIIPCYSLPSNKNDPPTINLSSRAAFPLIFSTIYQPDWTSGGHLEPEIRWIIAMDFVFRRMFSFKVSIPERYENINSRTMKKCLFVLFMSRDVTSRLVTELLLQ